MKRLKSVFCAVTVTVALSATTLAGNIGGMRTNSAGNIGGMRTSSTGNIGGMRTESDETSLDYSLAIYGNIGGMIQFLFLGVTIL
jgi:hypothetical protein